MLFIFKLIIMMNSVDLIVKTFVRSAIDSCILPGTSLGTEILWLYCKEWKKEFSGILFALLSLLFVHFDLPADLRSEVREAFANRKLD